MSTNSREKLRIHYHLLAGFADLPSAYDSVSIAILRKKMEHMVRQTGAGLPQGAVTSPDLFNLYTSNIKNVSDVEIKYLVKWYRGMKTFSQWCQASGCTLLEPKCNVVIFTRRRKYMLQNPLP